MKKLGLTSFLAIFISVSNAQTNPPGLKVNDKAPEFSAKDQNGKTISLQSELKNDCRPLVIYFHSYPLFYDNQNDLQKN